MRVSEARSVGDVGCCTHISFYPERGGSQQGVLCRCLLQRNFKPIPQPEGEVASSKCTCAIQVQAAVSLKSFFVPAAAGVNLCIWSHTRAHRR